jgi:hypothetical protein
MTASKGMLRPEDRRDFNFKGIGNFNETRPLNAQRDQIRGFEIEESSADKIRERQRILRDIEIFSSSFIHLESTKNRNKIAIAKNRETIRKSKKKISPGLFRKRTIRGAIAMR